MAETLSTPAVTEVWTRTFDEYFQTAEATQGPGDGVLAVNLDTETPESLHRFSLTELSALALTVGARRSGKKAVIIERMLSRHHARGALADETVESLQLRKVAQLNALLKSAGLPTSYGNKAKKARLLIDWREGMLQLKQERLARAKHELTVSGAIVERQYHQAIANGKMAVSRAEAIIHSAGLEVPGDLSAPAQETRRKGGRATRALENAEIRALFAHLGGRYAIRNRAMLMVGIHLALRATELCGLTVGDVYDGENVRTYITIRGEIAKGGNGRTLRMSSDVRRSLLDFIQWKVKASVRDSPPLISRGERADPRESR